MRVQGFVRASLCTTFRKHLSDLLSFLSDFESRLSAFLESFLDSFLDSFLASLRLSFLPLLPARMQTSFTRAADPAR